MDRTTLYLFDTSVLLNLVRGKELGRYINETFHLSEVIRRPLISVVTHGEIWAMAERRKWSDDKRTVLQGMLDDLVTIDLNDGSIIQSYVIVDQANQSHPSGARIMSDNDLWIAATARSASAILLTTDKDFLHLPPDVCAVHYIDPSSRLGTSDTGDQPKLI